MICTFQNSQKSFDSGRRLSVRIFARPFGSVTTDFGRSRRHGWIREGRVGPGIVPRGPRIIREPFWKLGIWGAIFQNGTLSRGLVLRGLRQASPRSRRREKRRDSTSRARRSPPPSEHRGSLPLESAAKPGTRNNRLRKSRLQHPVRHRFRSLIRQTPREA